MPILAWYFPLIMFFAACDMALSPPRARKPLMKARSPLASEGHY
jgi:hypothetical protein